MIRFTCEDGTCKKLEKKIQGGKRPKWAEPEPPVLLDTLDPCMLPEVHRSFVVSAERIRRVIVMVIVNALAAPAAPLLLLLLPLLLFFLLLLLLLLLPILHSLLLVLLLLLRE